MSISQVPTHYFGYQFCEPLYSSIQRNKKTERTLSARPITKVKYSTFLQIIIRIPIYKSSSEQPITYSVTTKLSS